MIKHQTKMENLLNRDKTIFEVKCKDGISVFLPIFEATYVFKTIAHYFEETDTYETEIDFTSHDLIVLWIGSTRKEAHMDFDGTMEELFDLCRDMIKLADFLEVEKGSDAYYNYSHFLAEAISKFLFDKSDIKRQDYERLLDKCCHSYTNIGISALIDHIENDVFTNHPEINLYKALLKRDPSGSSNIFVQIDILCPLVNFSKDDKRLPNVEISKKRKKELFELMKDMPYVTIID